MLRVPDDPFYKRFAAEASRFQICIDVFAFGATYMDLPSLGALPRWDGVGVAVGGAESVLLGGPRRCCWGAESLLLGGQLEN